MKEFELVEIKGKKEKADISFLNFEKAEKIRKYHKSFPDYTQTPLINLKCLAEKNGIAGLYVKDESYRFGLNAFKVLGGSYAIGNYLAQILEENEISYEILTAEENRSKMGDITFVTATDGNHGRGIAYTANKLKQNSIVYMPKGSSEERLKNIQAEGAEAFITDVNYDEAVRFANKQAEEKGYVLVQDTAWEGYEDIPRWIIQGYMTMGLEVYEQIDKKPTHIFLQAGVGSMATAMTGFFSNVYKEEKPIITIVEPTEANCIFKTAKAADGKTHPVTGDMQTIMAGLACGEPCSIGWQVLESYADYAISCPDYIAANGMRILGNPVEDDIKVVSGESGAVTIGIVETILNNKKFASWKEKLGLDENSVILCFSTEGDTDKENYRRIVWDGKYTSEL